MTRPDVLVVGEAPGSGGLPPGGPLACEAYEAKMPGLLQLERVNLLQHYPGRETWKRQASHNGRGSAFPMAEARSAAEALWASRPLSTAFVVVSVRASKAFGLGRSIPAAESRRLSGSWELGHPYCEWFEHLGRRFAVVPHPSGVVRWWNEPGNRDAAASLFRGIAEGVRP